MKNDVKLGQGRWLLVDDEREVSVAEDVATNEQRARELLLSTEYELVILDYKLGLLGGNGLSLLEWMIREERLPPIVFIISSHYSGRKAIEQRLTEIGYHERREKITKGDTRLPCYWKRI